jgi:NAD dependent epimerase/dehydratase family enzyme
LRFLKNTLIKNKIKIDSIISASGIGAYPSSYDKEYDENETERSKYFLADVIKEWEQATSSFNDIIKNVSIIRIGLVLSKKRGCIKTNNSAYVIWFWCLFWVW